MSIKMEIDSKNIFLFKNLSEFDYENLNLDLHNDFNCIKIMLNQNILNFLFQNISNKDIISFSFQNAEITVLEFDFSYSTELLTIDNLYRGRFEKNNKLIEFENNKGYFYLEFYDGQKVEFWSDKLLIEKLSHSILF